VLSRTLQRIEPKLIRIYRSFSDPPTPNLRGDRDVEYSWILANLPPGPGKALEFGCANGWLSLTAARRGFDTTGIDLTPVKWFYVHPGLRFIQTDIFNLDLPSSSLDLIINCSTVEHVGLARYGDAANPDGDIEAMARLRQALKPKGVMLLTIPVGQDATIVPLHRIYGQSRLPRLLDGFIVEQKEYWTKDDQNRWRMANEREALSEQLRPNIYALGCFVLTISEATQKGSYSPQW
jgi:SAM-dependent methyltransferase